MSDSTPGKKRRRDDILSSKKKIKLGPVPGLGSERLSSTHNGRFQPPVDMEVNNASLKPTITRPSQFSRLRDDLPFKPAEEDVKSNPLETVSQKASLFNALTALERQVEEISSMLARPAVYQMNESGPINRGDDRAQTGHSPDVKKIGETQNHESEIDRTDMLIFRESIHAVLRRLLAISSRMPVSEWPRQSPTGDFRLNLSSTLESMIDQSSKTHFIERYLEAHRTGWLPVVANVLPELATPAWVEHALLEHLLNLRHSLRFPNTPDKLRLKRRRERKNQLLQRKQTLLFHRKDEVMNDLLNMLGIDGMTDEESDFGEGETLLITRQPLWRSSELSSFLNGLDLQKPPNVMHPRRVIFEKNEKAVVILGLPVNCYCDTWLSQFPNRNLIDVKATLPIIFPDPVL